MDNDSGCIGTGCGTDMKITINITQEMIDNGLREDIKCCPVALAFNKAGYTNIIVLPSLAYNMHSIFVLSSDVNAFIDNFDRGRPVKPIEFEVIETIRTFIPKD